MSLCKGSADAKANPPCFHLVFLKQALAIFVSLLVFLVVTNTKLRNANYFPPFSSWNIINHGHVKQWNWTDVIPSRELIWHDCFDGFQCARLDVPLDWLDPSDEKRVALAVIKLPATDVKNYLGPVFTNPGGPGGSGVFAMKDRGKAIQNIIGTNHDLISFDPRGIGATTPQVECWPSKQRESLWNLRDIGVIDSHPGMLYDIYARSAAVSGLCVSPGSREKQSSIDVLSYVSTTSVARDMLEILDRGGWQKLRYWGFSYGTVLGGIFAAMYPERVERLVSDGNVDYTEWTTCRHENFVHDADRVMGAFYHFCHKAGLRCAFFDSSPDEIETRLDTLLKELKMHPIIVPITQRSSEVPEIVTYSTVKRFISAALYRPILLFPSLALGLAALEKGDGALFLDILETHGMYERFSYECDSSGMLPQAPIEFESYNDATRAIICSDGGGINETVDEFEKYAERIMGMSKAAGAVSVMPRIACVGWTTKAKWAFKGPFEGNTSHPILYVANKADNVTPLRSARRNSEGFPGSVVLIQNSYGHTTLSAPSICTAKHIRDYFQTGKLPSPNTECEADMEPFQLIHNSIYSRHIEPDLSSALLDLAKLDKLYRLP